MSNVNKDKVSKEDQSGKKDETKRSDSVEDCKKANPNDNAFCSMPDWKSCSPKDSKSKTQCFKLEECDKNIQNKQRVKKLNSVMIFIIQSSSIIKPFSGNGVRQFRNSHHFETTLQPHHSHKNVWFHYYWVEVNENSSFRYSEHQSYLKISLYY